MRRWRTVLEVLRSAIDAADWPRALEAALEAWRAIRAPELADLVEALGARCVVLPLPESSAQHHAWWIEHAARYEPAEVTYLASQAHQGADASKVTKPAIRGRWGDANPLIAALLAGSPNWFDAASPCSRLNAIDRLAAILAWPPDPRSAPLLAAALETSSLETWGTMLDPVCALVADALVALGDERILPGLADIALRAPEDINAITRARHASRAWHALEEKRRPPEPHLAALGAWLSPDTRTPPPARAGDRAAASLAGLWEQVAARPEEIGPRLVLGDALVELGETRGELILLQCAGAQPDAPPEDRARAEQRVQQLVEQQWERWLGSLAPFLHRSGCELRRGMVEVISVGVPGAPDTGWREAAGHHELFAVHTVRPHHVSPEHYALFVECLPRLPRHLGLDSSVAIELLGAHIGALSVETVSYSHHGRARPQAPESHPFPTAIAALANLVPELEVLALEGACPPDQVDALLPQLPRMFRRLRRVEVPQALLHGPRYRELLTRCRSLPFVKIIWARGSGPPS